MLGKIISNLEEKQKLLWGNQTISLKHNLMDTGLFSDDNIAELIEKLPKERVAINTMASSGHKAESWSYVDRANSTGHEIVNNVKSGQLWINITQIETLDDRFAELLEQIYSELEVELPDFQTFKRSVGLLISSPNAQVFYHADVPGQSLWQVRGKKRIYIYPNSEPFLMPNEMENVVRAVTEEEITYKEWFDEYAEVYDLEGGQMLHWQLNRPHRVVNLEGMNVSLTTEHWTPEIRRSYAMNYGNGLLRKFGFKPRSRITEGAVFWVKVALTAAWRLSGMHKHSAFKRDFKVSIEKLTQHHSPAE
jgi:hypothetical protein